MRYDLTPVKMAIINKSTNKCWLGVEKRNPHVLLAGMQTGAATLESSMEIPQNIKNGTASGPSNPASGNTSKNHWNTNSKVYIYLYVHCSTVYNNQDLEAAQVLTSRWVDKIAMVHLYNEILPTIKKKKILPFATAWVDLESIMLNEISQSEKDKCHMILLIYRI